MKIFVNIFPTNLVANSFLFPFCLLLETKKEKSDFQQVDALVAIYISVFLFIVCHSLLQRHTDFNRLLQCIFLHVTPVSSIVP